MTLKNLVRYLDRCRCAVLSKTMRMPVARWLYRQRAYRLFLWYLIAVAIHLPLALTFAPLVLIFGPLLFGIPHLLAGYRYLPQLVGPQNNVKSLRYIAALSLAAFPLLYIFEVPWSLQLMALTAVLFVSAFVVATCYTWKDRIIPLIGIGLTTLAFMVRPQATVGVLVLAHNAIAFFYWVQAAKRQGESWHAYTAGLIFVIVNCLILSGIADSYLNSSIAFGWVSRISNAAGFMPDAFASQIAPAVTEGLMLDRIIAAAALGQSLHYFVWLKAIPEQLQAAQVPTTYARDIAAAIRELGYAPLVVAGVLFIALGVCSTYSLHLAKQAYVYLASAHGYIELGAIMHPLALLRNRRYN